LQFKSSGGDGFKALAEVLEKETKVIRISTSLAAVSAIDR